MSDTIEFTMALVTKVTANGTPAAQTELINVIKPIITVPGESGFDTDLALLYQVAKL